MVIHSHALNYNVLLFLLSSAYWNNQPPTWTNGISYEAFCEYVIMKNSKIMKNSCAEKTLGARLMKVSS